MKDIQIKAEQSQVVFVSAATLEDRLLYDDVFVDYFNLFLQLKAFGTAIRYERLDGYYLDNPAENISNDEELQQLVDEHGKFLQQGAISLWVKEHRLPFFLRSRLFLEYKLCKLLLRKLSDTSRVEQSRLELRGYSRLSSPLVLPDSPEHWSDSPVDYASQASWPAKGPGQHYHRPLGSASSLPAMLSIALETRLRLLEGPPAKRMSNEEGHADLNEDDKCRHAERLKIRSECGRRTKNYRKRKTSLFTPSVETRENSKKGRTSLRRTRSAPVEGVEKREEQEDDGSEMFLNDFSEVDEDDTILCFDEEDVEKTEAELQSIIDESKRNLQEMKEDALNSSSGMKEFRDFLTGTSGLQLLNFWLDVEEFEDIEESSLEKENTLQMLRVKLFREINDKYKDHLTSEAKEKIREALTHEGLTKDLFTRTQYDTLRRLRSYWVPRFLVHKEKTDDEISSDSEAASRQSDGRTTLSFLPKISFVHSLPARAEWCTELARRSCDWSKNLALSDIKLQSKKKKNHLEDDKSDDSNGRFLCGLLCEKEAGWPFRAFLQRMDKKDELSSLLFWQSIEDLRDEEIRGCDRHLHLCNAWNIVKRFLSSSESKECVVKISELDKQKIIEKLRQSMEVSSALFSSGQTHAVGVLRTPWDEYLKDDKLTLQKSVKMSIGELSTNSKNGSKHGSLYQSYFIPGKWYPRYPESSPSERQRRLHTAMTIAENIETTRMSMYSPQKSPASVQKISRMKSRTSSQKPRSKEKTVKFNAKKEKSQVSKQRHESGADDDKAKVEEKPPPEFRDHLNDKTVMTSFKHHVQNTEGSHAMNSLALFLDIEAYNAIPPSSKSQRLERASQIYKNYFDQSSRKRVDLPASIPFQIKDECPTSPILVETQNYLLTEIEASFKQFHNFKPQKLPKPAVHHDTHHTVAGNKAETPFTSNSFVVYYKRRRNKFRGPGRVQPTKEDKVTFLNELRETYGVLSARMELFRRYLDNNDDVQADSISKLENDLLFYLEVQKFKDLFLYMDDTTLLKKVDAVVDCFLDSATPPSVQIDISTDLAGRTVHKAQALHTRSKLARDQRDCAIFDDAQNIVLKELLPFWAGFSRQYDSQSAEQEAEKLPPTRRQLIIKRRYSDFKTFPPKKRPVSLRSVLPSIGESKRELNYSVAEGLAWKETLSEADSGSIYSVNVRSSTGDNSHASRIL